MDLSNSTANVPQSVRTLETWGITLVAITALVCIPVAGVGIIPFVSRRTYQRIMVFFVALGVGSLTGNSVFHLIPHAYGVDMENSPHLLYRSWMILFGVYMFFCVDKLVAFVHVYKQMLRDKKSAHLQENRLMDQTDDSLEMVALTSPATSPTTVPTSPISTESLWTYHTANDDDAYVDRIVDGLDVERDSDDDDDKAPPPPRDASRCLHGDVHLVVGRRSSANSDKRDKLKNTARGKPLIGVPRYTVYSEECHRGHSHGAPPPAVDGKRPVIGTVAWMIIFGDGLHRLIDGLSVGVMMSNSILSGVSITLAILCEEVPHVLGDLAILVNAGMSLREALVYNMLSNIFCYIGAAIGIVAGEMESLANFVFAAAAGMFLYVALASMIPEMNKTMSTKMTKHWRSGVVVGALQLAGIAVGLLIIFLMAKFGAAIKFD